jgi:hypothetical protein
MAIHLTIPSILDAGAGSEHSGNAFTQLVLSLSRFKIIDLSLWPLSFNRNLTPAITRPREQHTIYATGRNDESHAPAGRVHWPVRPPLCWGTGTSRLLLLASCRNIQAVSNARINRARTQRDYGQVSQMKTTLFRAPVE